MIYINLNNWRKPIFRILKTKKYKIKNYKIKKYSVFSEKNEVIKEFEPSVKIVYELENNKLISKIETRQEYNTNYIASSLNDNVNYIRLLE